MSWIVEKRGFSSYDAIKAANITAAKVIGEKDRIGSVEKGKIADILVLRTFLNYQQL